MTLLSYSLRPNGTEVEHWIEYDRGMYIYTIVVYHADGAIHYIWRKL